MILDPHRLVLARQLRGLTRSALAARLGLPPTSQQPEHLAEVLSCPVPFLVPVEEHDTAIAEHPDAVFWRSLRSTPRPDRLRAQGFCGVLELLSAVLDEAGLPLPPVRLPLARGRDLDTPPTRTDPADAVAGLNPAQLAHQVRQAWDLVGDPLPEVLPLLEGRGILFAVLPEGDADTIAPLSFWGGRRPVVLLNHERDPLQCRLDAAHELGHLLMHRGLPSVQKQQGAWAPVRILEEQADLFARAFLVPTPQWIREAPRSVNPYAYLPHKERWGVPVRTLIDRSRDTGIFNQAQHAAAVRRYVQLGWGQGEPRSEVLDHEQPQTLRASVAGAARRAEFPPGEFLLEVCSLPRVIIDLVLPAGRPVLSLQAHRDRLSRAIDDPRVQAAAAEHFGPVYDPAKLPL